MIVKCPHCKELAFMPDLEPDDTKRTGFYGGLVLEQYVTTDAAQIGWAIDDVREAFEKHRLGGK